ncbi:hypothetical protein Y032_0086g1926 [Ancylostoma ceylanicum]|uniref:Uncharacterized protein n=1 Tax=Ancylostoma ceylanicum TaxID=53326 RepID=A0A016TPI1_9BILA|nr:hypothetical protein Y032_0086g1926 [Ancylostoma ceylanicum]
MEMSGNNNSQGADEYEEVPEVPEVELQDERGSELRTLRQTLRLTQAELAHEHNYVLRLTHQCRELCRRADAQEERADNQRKRRLEGNEVFWQKLRRARAEAADGKRMIENLKEVALGGTHPARQRHPSSRGVNPLLSHHDGSRGNILQHTG